MDNKFNSQETKAKKVDFFFCLMIFSFVLWFFLLPRLKVRLIKNLFNFHNRISRRSTFSAYTRKNAYSYDGHSLYQHWCLIICIHQSWFIWYQHLPSVLLVHHACYNLFLQTATVCSQYTCIILLHQTDTALTTQQTVPVWYSDTVSSEQSVGDNSLIQLWYHTCIRSEGATGCNSSVAFLRV